MTKAEFQKDMSKAGKEFREWDIKHFRYNKYIEIEAYEAEQRRSAKLEAELINNSPLRGYDGLADELDAERKQSAELLEALEIIDVLRQRIRELLHGK